MSLRIEINCHCDFRCDCKPIIQTKVTKQEVAYNLMRCNPALTRYFSNHISHTETVVDRKEIKRESPKPYQSIVEQKNMNILLSDRYPPPVIEQPQKREDIVEIKIDNFVNTYVQTSPRNLVQEKKTIPKTKKDPTEEQIREYYRQLKQTSRYLSNTSFKKYFNRPIFENYGRENTKGTNDGIIYGNYLKTHNINPHLGENRPHDEETFYHALISASPEKFLGPKAANVVEQQKGKNLPLTRLKEDESLEKPIKRHDNKQDIIIMDNVHQHTKLNNLSSQTKLSPKSRHSPHIQSKSPKVHQAKPVQSIKSQYVNNVQHIQPVKPKIQRKNLPVSPRNKLNQEKQQIQKLSQIRSRKNQETKSNLKISEQVLKREENKCPVVKIRQSHMEHILSPNCNVKKSQQNLQKPSEKASSKKGFEKMDFGSGSPKLCTCSAQQGKGKCQCLSKVKNELKQMAQKDIDLSNRLVTSARKTTLYKNYALNSGQNAKLNPHNYTNCCGSIYQK